jgi:hypothetical protein
MEQVPEPRTGDAFGQLLAQHVDLNGHSTNSSSAMTAFSVSPTLAPTSASRTSWGRWRFRPVRKPAAEFWTLVAAPDPTASP